MKFYIASRVKNKDLVSKLHTKLIKLGHEVLSTWIDEKDIIPYEKHTGESARRASQCLDGSRRCDVLILITDESGAGMYTELGAALTSKRTRIYVIGNYLDRSVFFFHPKVKRFETISEVLRDLDK